MLQLKGENLATTPNTQEKDTDTMLKGLGAVTLIALIIAIIVFGPLATIWAANTLFPVLAIPYTFWTWLAVIVLGGFFRARVSNDKKD